MVWQDKYDKINSTFDGDHVIFGEHCTLKQAKDIMKKEDWDDDIEINKFKKIEKVWLHFGFIYDDCDDEVKRGWKVCVTPPKSMKGTILGTIIS